MRRRMAEHKAPRGPLDVKLMRGGLVDIEFIVHFLQLRDGARHPSLLDPDLATAIAAIAPAGILPLVHAGALAGAQAFLTRLLIASRLLAPDCAEPPSSSLPSTAAFPSAAVVLANACQCDDWSALMARLGSARAAVAPIWAEVFGEKLEVA